MNNNNYYVIERWIRNKPNSSFLIWIYTENNTALRRTWAKTIIMSWKPKLFLYINFWIMLDFNWYRQKNKASRCFNFAELIYLNKTNIFEQVYFGYNSSWCYSSPSCTTFVSRWCRCSMCCSTLDHLHLTSFAHKTLL